MPTYEEVKKEYAKILEQLSDPELISNWEKFEELSQEKTKYEKVIAKTEEREEVLQKIEESKTLAATERDTELLLLAENELKELRAREKVLREDIEELLRGADEKQGASREKQLNVPEALIMEIRAGVGGQESSLFAGDLFRMYSKYAQSRGWKQKIFDSNPTELGGFKSIIFEIRGRDAWGKLQYEAGVHRVQRIPKTEKSGRVHTSTCSVAVLPRPRKEEIKIRPDDLKIEAYRASGPGGQYVNKRETAVRITHLPSGIIVTSQTERGQLQNRESAMAILGAKLLEQEREAEQAKMAGARKAQIGAAKRAEKIRTYNFPQDRVTDHRAQKSWHNIEEIMAGKLDPIIKILTFPA